MNREEKLERLKTILKEMKKLCVAFSGGVDSTFLLYFARKVLGDNVIAVNIVSPLSPESEKNDANTFVREIGAKLLSITMNPLVDVEGFSKNPKDRCYYCKKAIFTKIIGKALDEGIDFVADGTNADDLSDYRPGLIALKELGIRSPLLEAGITKDDIREYSKIFGLKTYKKPSIACLASRIPYGEEINVEKLRRVDLSEDYLRSKGFLNIRVRSHGDIARIEVGKEEIPKFFDMDLIGDVDLKLKEFGFKFVCLDLSGYKTGNMNYNVFNNIK